MINGCLERLISGRLGPFSFPLFWLCIWLFELASCRTWSMIQLSQRSTQSMLYRGKDLTDAQACWPSHEINSTYNLQPLSQLFFNRRESPWKVDVESSGVPAKLRLLEQELINLEKVVNGDLSKIPLVMRKQVKRYQTLAGKIDDLCKRMVGLLVWNSIYLLSYVLLLNAKYLIYHSIVHNSRM